MRPPIGFVADRTGPMTLSPDTQIQQTVRLSGAFRRTGSAEQVVRHFAREGLNGRGASHRPRRSARLRALGA
jgi:hypothetical protein